MRNTQHPSTSTVEARVVFSQAIRFLRAVGVARALRFRRAVWNWLMSSRKRKAKRRGGALAPVAIALSPTMRCNLSCAACYAADYPRDDEMSLETMHRLLTSAEDLGVFTVVVTGGEPLLRDGLLDLLVKHRGLVFLLVTNGMLVDDGTARKLAGSGNIFTAVSLEGLAAETDARRGPGTHEAALEAMRLLYKHGAVFGFSTTVTRSNWELLAGQEFADEMTSRGCTLGFHTEYVPVGSGQEYSSVLTDEERAEFRSRLLRLRHTRPLILVHLPDDEYGPDGRCHAVAGGSVHINSQGYVEPCPFCHYAAVNIRDTGLEQAVNSSFLCALRSSDALCRKTRIGCALVENSELVEEIAIRTGAVRTDVASPPAGGQRH